jgi:RNA polymerase sigma-70 factor (ECF subfamily)
VTKMFDELLNRERPLLLRFAYTRTRNLAEAEDLVQDTLIRAWEKRAQLRDGKALSVWLRTVLIRLHIDRVRVLTSRENKCPETPLEDLVGIEPSVPDVMLARITAMAFVDECMKQKESALPYFDAITLYADGLTYEEIATIQNVPIGSVRSRIARARDVFRPIAQRVA